MWLFSFIPDSIIASFIHTIVAIGGLSLLGGFLLSRILGPWAQMARIFGTIALIAGVYFEGGLQTELHWRDQIRIQQEEIARLQAQSEVVTEKVVTKYIERVKVVKEKQNAIIKEVPKYITKEADANCTIPKSFVVLHDAAAKNQLPDTTRGIDEAASGINLSDVARTITINYGTYHQLSEELTALQDWVREQKKLNP